MWTADEATYRQAFLESLDYYLNLADTTANRPSEYQSRWNCDGSLWMWTYEQNRSASAFDRLINRIRDGHISVPLTTAVSTYGGQPTEAVLRNMYYAGSIERRYNLRFPLAVAMENQTLPFGLGSLWAGAGARYSWRGICGCATQVPQPGDREHDIYWWVGPDDSRVLMKWNTFFSHDSIGGYAEARRLSEAVNIVDTNGSFLARYPYRIAGIFGKGHDDLKTLTDEFVTSAPALTNSSRQIIVSNEQDFFQDFEANYGASLPSVSCTYGNEWDLYCASLAETSASVKRSVEKLRGAEALATLVSLQNPNFMASRAAARQQAWVNMGLYWEHAWTADGPVGRIARRDWQRRVASDIGAYVDILQSDAVSALGGMIQKSGSNLRFYAFNQLGWSRTDIADFPYSGATPVHVIDVSTGLETPSQIVFPNGVPYLRVLAKDMPPVGYKVFEVRSGAGSSFTQAASVSGGTIENDFYRLTVADRGAITSLIDKTRGNREFARTVNGRAINDLGSSSGTLTLENAGPVSVTLLATSPGPLQHTSRITLIRDSRRIDISNNISQNFGDVRTWGFGFNLDSPDVWHEEVGAVIRAKLQSQGGHYSDRAHNSRYDWLTLNHFADINGANGTGVTLSNADCYFMKLGNSTAGSLDTLTPQISPLIGGQVDGVGLGIQNQGGDSSFTQRFALQTHDAQDTTSSMRFALEHQNPLITGLVTGGSAYPEGSFSLLTISDPNVLLWALKPAEEGIGNGMIARIWNVSGNPVNFNLTMAQPLTSARRTTHIETDLSNATINGGALSTSIAARQLQTYRLTMNALPAPSPSPSPTPTPTPTPTNPIDTTSFFVRQHYLDFLSREPDPPGLAGWIDILNNCPAGSTACDRIEVSSAFFRSPEFYDRGFFIYRFYAGSLGRKPQFAEFGPDFSRVSGFLTTDQLEANKVAFINDFITRPEFRGIYDQLNAQAFVDRLQATSGAALPNKIQLVAALQSGQKTRAQVLREVVEDAAVTSKFYVESFVVMQYFGYLRRDPDALYLDWIQIMNGNPNNYRQMVNGFVNSLEYRARFAP
jgi:alpha-mannosidase